jgi:HAD superfamily hydrolase (TIGR01509 family)
MNSFRWQQLKIQGATIAFGETRALIVHRPSYVLFDVGNVLVHIEPAQFLRSLSIDTPELREYYQSKIIDIAKRYERGDDSTQVFLTNLDLLFNAGDGNLRRARGGKDYFSPGDFRNAMLSIIGAPVEGMEEIVQRVSSAAQVGLLSNTNPIHFDYCVQRFRAVQSIPTHLLSYQMKALKPEPEIFARASLKIPFPPNEILYVDDIAENVAAARDAGFMGHQFIGTLNIEQLFIDLRIL